MVVLCLRFRTGTQILIYFPVLLQISSVTLGQLLWEKHVKAPKWLTNPSPFSKRGIAADSQRDKHVGTLPVARATPKVTVCCPITFQFWAPAGHRAPREMSVFWMPAGDGMGGISCCLTFYGYCGAGSLGSCSLLWFPASAQFSLAPHLWERLKCDARICAGRRCQECHGQ